MKKNENMVTAIFDLDGTLYPRENKFFHYLEIRTQEYMMSKCPELTLEKFEEMEKRIPSVLDALDYLNISRKEFYKDVYNGISYKDFFKEDKLLKSLLNERRKNQKNFIVTMSGYTEINEITTLLGINKYIERAYSPEKTNIKSKKDIYVNILKQYNTDVQNIFVIGDDYNVDILPAIELGFKTIFITNKKKGKPKNVDFVAKDIYDVFNIL